MTNETSQSLIDQWELSISCGSIKTLNRALSIKSLKFSLNNNKSIFCWPILTLNLLLTKENSWSLIDQWELLIFLWPIRTLSFLLTNDNSKFLVDQWQISMFCWPMTTLNLLLTNDNSRSIFCWPMTTLNLWSNLLSHGPCLMRTSIFHWPMGTLNLMLINVKSQFLVDQLELFSLHIFLTNETFIDQWDISISWWPMRTLNLWVIYKNSPFISSWRIRTYNPCLIRRRTLNLSLTN